MLTRLSRLSKRSSSPPFQSPRAWLATLVTLWGLCAALPAQNLPPDPVDGGLDCKQVDGGVLVQWSIVFIRPIDGWVIARDGAGIAKLGPDESSYFDADVEAGSHRYDLYAIDLGVPVAGDILPPGPIAWCRIDVEAVFGVRCKAEENKVHISWGPILIDVLITKFRISRNGQTIATVPPDQLEYTDEVYSLGGYGYSVYAVTSPTSEFLLGSCRVVIRCFGLKTEVSGLKVALAWNGSGTIGSILPNYLITRNDELVAKTSETSYVDEVPGPGEYVYQITEDFGPLLEIPVRIIAVCLVTVPGAAPPGPRDLVCTILPVDIEPGPLPGPIDVNDPSAYDANGDGVVDSILPFWAVGLTWSNPADYDKVLILRNGTLVASLEGSATRFIDRVRVGGVYEYAVRGVVGDVLTTAARCRVEIPLPVILPPRDLTCELIDIVFAPDDPTNPSPPPANAVDAPAPLPVPVVLLRWWNPIRYAKLVVLRDGDELTRLPGDATSYRDIAPPAGKRVYAVYGIVEDGRASPRTFCEVEVGGTVPPVVGLQCIAEQLSASTGGSVILVWENATIYDKIFIIRDGAVIFEDTGDLRKYIDRGLEPGTYTYCVVAVIGDRRSRAVCCSATIVGPPRTNLLYFTPGLSIDPVPVDLAGPLPIPDPLPPLPGPDITCLADNRDPLQGWSFGVASDPSLIVPESADIAGTSTQALNGGAGPAFLHIESEDDGSGIVMAVVVGIRPTTMLPVAAGHRLLNIHYVSGPDGKPGEPYPVRYSDGLGSPPVQVIFVVEGFEVLPRRLPGWVSLPGPRFLRADSNGDGEVDISDGRHILNYLFLGGRTPGCFEASNANGSSALNIADAIYVFSFLFGGGAPPPFPFPFCAFAPAPLGCREPGACLSPVDG